MAMKTVSARQANHEFSDLLCARGTRSLITKRSKPVAVLSPYRPPQMTAERKKPIQHAIGVMAKGLHGVTPYRGSIAKKCMSGDGQL
jgi:prevent-host-death family protein